MKNKFPLREYTVTSKNNNVTKGYTRHTTIGKHLWTNADIDYYEKLDKLINKIKDNNTVNSLIDEVELESVKEV